MRAASSTAEALPPLSDEDYDLLMEDMEAYAAECLFIRPKAGALEPFRFNASQRFVDTEAESMLAELGYVRLVVLKGRQQGISTWVGGRFYRKTSNTQGFRAFILTHLARVTKALFQLTQRFHENCPADVKPAEGANSSNELTFPELDSGYEVATAGGREAGRGLTIQLAHLSEFGFWPNAEENLTSVLEAVPLAENTEVIAESTARKFGDTFHKFWKAAKAGNSEYRAIFVPWYLHEEYATQPPEGWVPPPAFARYQKAHRLTEKMVRARLLPIEDPANYVITDAQIYWAWSKNRNMCAARGLSPDEFCPKFKREYPANDDEAFEGAGNDITRVFPHDWIKLAQARWIENRDKPKQPMTAIGVDVAQGGEDSTVVAPLHGKRFEQLEKIAGEITIDGPAVAAAVLRHVRGRPKIAVDTSGGWGGDALTQLKGLSQDAVGVNAGAGSDYVAYSNVTDENGKTKREPLFEMYNERAALFWQFHEALNPESGEDIELPPNDELEEEMLEPTFEITPRGLLIEPKEEISAPDRLGRSTDNLDAVLLAWRAQKLRNKQIAVAAKKKPPPPPAGSFGGGGTFFGS